MFIYFSLSMPQGLTEWFYSWELYFQWQQAWVCHWISLCMVPLLQILLCMTGITHLSLFLSNLVSYRFGEIYSISVWPNGICFDFSSYMFNKKIWKFQLDLMGFFSQMHFTITDYLSVFIVHVLLKSSKMKKKIWTMNVKNSLIWQNCFIQGNLLYLKTLHYRICLKICLQEC